MLPYAGIEGWNKTIGLNSLKDQELHVLLLQNDISGFYCVCVGGGGHEVNVPPSLDSAFSL